MPPKSLLTEAQKRMYDLEKLDNFRWVSRLLADCSPRPLGTDDLVPLDLSLELAELGQFAELAYSTVPLNFVFENLATLTQPDYPLEGYDALSGSKLVTEFFGTAKLHVFVAWRNEKRQLIVGISGTANLQQALHDLRGLKHALSSGRGSAHSGFWDLYKGIKVPALEAIRNAMGTYDVAELVVTGHSLGGAVSYFLTMRLMEEPFLNGVKLKLAVFGSPRPGDPKLAESWQEMVGKYRSGHGEHSFEEYSVKAYNDGVPTLPPKSLGYCHFTRNPLYFVHGHLYRIPETESEYALFKVPEIESPEWVRGGHNYYGRDIEKAVRRRMGWLDKALGGKENWEERYKAYIKKENLR